MHFGVRFFCLLAALLLPAAAFAQMGPDLQPKLIAKPVKGNTADSSENPKMLEPPKGPTTTSDSPNQPSNARSRPTPKTN
jgi:hypothetical protein